MNIAIIHIFNLVRLENSNPIIMVYIIQTTPYLNVLSCNHSPLTMAFQICKEFCKIFNNLIFNQEKLKMCKFTLTSCLQKICNFFSQNLCNSFPYVKLAFQKAKFYQNLGSGSGSKQRFSLLHEKAVIQAVCLRTYAVSIKARF